MLLWCPTVGLLLLALCPDEFAERYMVYLPFSSFESSVTVFHQIVQSSGYF